MLHTFRKYRKSFLSFFVIGVCALLMGGFGLGSVFSPPNSQAAATIDEEEIPYGDYYRRLQQIEGMLRNQYGENFQQVRKFLRLEQQAIDSTINQYLIARFSNELGLAASTKQIEQQVLSYPFFEDGFTQARYQSFLRALGLTEAGLEQSVRNEIIYGQLTTLLQTVSAPSKKELLSLYEHQESRSQFRYLTFAAEKFTEKIEIDQAGLKSFFEKGKEAYRKPATVRYAYVGFDANQFQNSVEVVEEELQELYQSRAREFREPAEVRYREIFFAKTEKETSPLGEALGLEEGEAGKEEIQQSTLDPDDVKENLAKDALNRLQEGADFATLAREISENKESAEKGGDKGWVRYDRLPVAVGKALSELEIQKTSEIIETEEGFFLLQVEEKKESRQKPLSEVRVQLEKDFRQADAPLYAAAEASSFLDLWEDSGQNLGEFAKTQNQQSKSTGRLMHSGENPPDVWPGLTANILQLSEGERKVFDFPSGSYVVEVTERRDSYLPELDEVKEKVTEDYQREETKKYAQKIAEEALLALRKEDSQVHEVANKHSLEVQETELFTKGEAKGPLFSMPGAKDALFALREEQKIPSSVLGSGETFYVAELVKRVSPEESRFEEEEAALRESTAKLAGDRMFSALVQSLREAANIWVNPELFQVSS